MHDVVQGYDNAGGFERPADLFDSAQGSQEGASFSHLEDEFGQYLLFGVHGVAGLPCEVVCQGQEIGR